MKHRTALLPAVLLLLALAAGARAERADRDQPMHIEADSLVHDEAKQTSVFSGNVVITKGSIVLRGAEVQVTQDDAGNQSGVVTAAPGKRAYFRQQRDTPKGAPVEIIEGEAERIDWNGRTEVVKLTRRAELRRLRAGALSDEVSGAIITYNNATDVFSVDGAPRRAGDKSDTRVRATLAPKEAPAAGAPQGAQEAPELRPSRALDAPPQ
ncbi:lipopolysaccharide transport periplasmic protein LptA [Comamonas sp. NLF-1-9]|uniref:lipopolysaccharide transport periplasmic protein LptA n=1 Tax=Comamonas sp. NLF-1-9 TaxID=2853163 RepID=UPI001C444D51|nr:lipopolysaccharide transport periplasmic protein LptA [Comamonas sp. NLF-1-9]QXL83843.1 lipopolysaccharide transport periplasmic protein LptA [Comamonas sp. NLF-1-9]